jgi:recombination protein RecA
MFGSPKTTTGGNALKFYASVRIEVSRVGSVKKGEEDIGSRTRVKIVKNKLAPPFRKCEFDIYYGEGVCQASELLDLGLEQGFVKKSGSWFSVDDERAGQGRENARQYLKDAPEIMASLRRRILEKSGVVEPAPVSTVDGEAPEA